MNSYKEKKFDFWKVSEESERISIKDEKEKKRNAYAPMDRLYTAITSHLNFIFAIQIALCLIPYFYYPDEVAHMMSLGCFQILIIWNVIQYLLFEKNRCDFHRQEERNIERETQ